WRRAQRSLELSHEATIEGVAERCGIRDRRTAFPLTLRTNSKQEERSVRRDVRRFELQLGQRTRRELAEERKVVGALGQAERDERRASSARRHRNRNAGRRSRRHRIAIRPGARFEHERPERRHVLLTEQSPRWAAPPVAKEHEDE